MIAHAGDGNTHPIIVYPAGDSAAAIRANQAFAAVMELALTLGGTITVGDTAKVTITDTKGTAREYDYTMVKDDTLATASSAIGR